MARVKLIPSVSFEVHMILTEAQVRALAELASYSAKDTVNDIVKTSTVLGKYSKDLISFLEDCGDTIKPQLSRIDASRNAINE